MVYSVAGFHSSLGAPCLSTRPRCSVGAMQIRAGAGSWLMLCSLRSQAPLVEPTGRDRSWWAPCPRPKPPSVPWVPSTARCSPPSEHPAALPARRARTGPALAGSSHIASMWHQVRPLPSCLASPKVSKSTTCSALQGDCSWAMPWAPALREQEVSGPWPLLSCFRFSPGL